MDRMYGWAYYGLNQPQQSVDALSKFISSAPDKVIYDDYKYLGRAYGMVNTPQADSLSIVYLEKAAPLDTTENLYRDIAKKYYDMKKYNKSADYYGKVVSTDKKPLNNDYLYQGLANYQYGFRVGRDSTEAPMDTAQIRMARQMYFMRADSAFGKMAAKIEADTAATSKYPLAYYYEGQSNYYAFPSAVSLARGTAVPYYEKFIEQATAEKDQKAKDSYKKPLITSYKFLASYYGSKNDDAKAKEYFNKVLELDPNDADVQKALNPAPAKAAPAKAAPKKTVKK